jgi:outer membrane protein TolC
MHQARCCGTPRNLTWVLQAMLLLPGCAPVGTLPAPPAPTHVELRTAQSESSGVRQVALQQQLPEPSFVTPPLTPPQTTHPLPVSFDTVLRLTQDQNGQINLAREKIRQASAETELAEKNWLPNLYTGVTYYRHEGGIQNFDGTFIHSSYGSLFGGMEVGGRLDLRDLAFQKIDAERRLWQQKGELSKLTSENLLDAGGTYIDLLSARTSEAIHRALLNELVGLLGTAQRIAKVEPANRVEVSRVETEIHFQRQQLRKTQEQAKAAAAKLVYLLGVGPEVELVPVEYVMAPLPLVDAGVAVQEMLALAMTDGPGVRETQRILALLEEARQKGQGAGRYVPTFEMRMAEGVFGAGPGSRSTWDNRWDLGLQARWNLGEYLMAREKQRIAQSQMSQLHLSYQDLKAKLAAGVQEAYEAVRSAQDQMLEAQAMIEHARETLKWSRYRLTELELQKRAAPSEVLLALQAQAGAQLAYLAAVRDFNRAQVRLLVLIGTLPAGCTPGNYGPVNAPR